MADDRDAKLHVERLSESRVSFPSIAFLLAVRHFVLGELELAERRSGQTIADDADDADAWMLRCAIARRTHDARLARAAERRAMRVDPTLLSPLGRSRHEHIERRRRAHFAATTEQSGWLVGDDARLVRAEACAAIDEAQFSTTRPRRGRRASLAPHRDRAHRPRSDRRRTLVRAAA